jgi:hypothetical protein
VSAAAKTGAQSPAPTAGQPLNTGDQGTATAGQSLPGSTGSSTGGSGTPPPSHSSLKLISIKITHLTNFLYFQKC